MSNPRKGNRLGPTWFEDEHAYPRGPVSQSQGHEALQALADTHKSKSAMSRALGRRHGTIGAWCRLEGVEVSATGGRPPRMSFIVTAERVEHLNHAAGWRREDFAAHMQVSEETVRKLFRRLGVVLKNGRPFKRERTP